MLINLRSKLARKKLLVRATKILLMTLALFAIAGRMTQGDWWNAGLLTLVALIVIIPRIFPPKKDRPKTR